MARTADVLTVRIGADLKDVLSGLNALGARAEKLGRSMQNLGRGLTRNVTTPLAAAGAAAVAAGIRMGNAADALLDLEQQTGLSTDALQEFRRVSTVAGVEQDTLGKAAQQLTMRMARGAEGSADMRAALQQLGISATDAHGNLRPMEQVVNEAVAGLSGMEDATQRNILATKLFSRSASDLAPILGLGSDAIARARDEAHDMGLVINREALEAANAFRIQIDTLTETMKAQVSQIGLAVIPALSKLAEIVQDRVVPVVRQAVEWLGTLETRTLLIVGAVGALVAAIGPAIIVLGTLVGAAGKLLLVLNPVSLTIGLIVAALASVVTVTAVVAKNWDVLALQGTLAWTAIKDAVFGAISGILGMLESLPLVGDKITELREKFDDFANDSLANSNDRIIELERNISANGAAFEAFTPQVEAAAEVVTNLGGALNIANAGFREVAVTLPGIPDSLDLIAPATVTAINALDDVTTSAGAFGQEVGSVVLSGVDGFATLSTSVGDFVKGAIAQLSRLVAKMLVVKAVMSFLPGVGSFLGFGGGLGKFAGMFATGGFIPQGQFGIAGEAGTEVVSRPTVVQGPANVTPMTGGGETVLQFPAPRSNFERMAQDYLAEGLRQLGHSGFRVEIAK
jgi:hypothetical protein